MRIKTIREWLATPCKDSEIAMIDGAFYLPIDVVLDKINVLRYTFNADVHTFAPTHQYFKTAAGEDICSGNIQLSVTCPKEAFNIQCSGAATIFLRNYTNNLHYAATVKSLAIMNACKMLGPQFGSHLNEIIEKEHRQKPPLDIVMREKYKKALEDNDKETIKSMEESYDVKAK